MGNATEKYVKSIFGPTCGSAELRALREEYLEKARAAYDRELASGATERQANDRALAAISAAIPDMKRVLWEKDIPKKQSRWKTRIAIVLFSAAALLLFGAILLTHRDFQNVLFDVKVLVIAIGLLAFGKICLLWKTRVKFIPILCFVIGSVLLLSVLNHLDVEHYDYRDRLDRIQSVELIELTKTAGYEDELEYQVLRSIDPAEWEGLIDDVARLDYHYFFPNPQWWSGGPVWLLIRFTPGEDGLRFAIIGESPATGTEKGSRVEIFAVPCATNGWEALAEKYGLAIEP